ncbi:hypothetical protein ANCDUO_05133 [Ancylostoma duodenale]|uniref:tRNA-splicing endonuclease subunit Sen54 N-terminal domain-containing protein n=1 Tax=Ancylostoma duodenale TaxID=51022 RepID=A0A0C2D4U1_9BILA|nr:hypothetical protein ANCDUO_05133 [Ancylostoma duodenale]
MIFVSLEQAEFIGRLWHARGINGRIAGARLVHPKITGVKVIKHVVILKTRMMSQRKWLSKKSIQLRREAGVWQLLSSIWSTIDAFYLRGDEEMCEYNDIKNYLASMGVPLKNGGHVLFPEEAVYLVEVS